VSVEGSAYLAAVTEDDFLRALPLADRLRIVAVDLAVTRAPPVLVESMWLVSGGSRCGWPSAGLPNR
jgi:hypothetical protein